MTLSVIVAMASNGVIGSGGKLPWHLPDDLRRFKALTLGHPVIMGRRTWESMGKPLAGRRNLVVSRRSDWNAEGAEVVPSLAEALARCAAAEEVFVIGGAELYREALLRADRLYITRVQAHVPGDARFPSWDETAWRLETEEHHPADARHAHAFRFCVYTRR